MAITNTQRQRVRSLQQRKWRRKYNAFVVEGLVNVNEVLTSPLTVEELYHTPEVTNQLQALDSLNPGQLYAVSAKELDRLSGQRSPHGVLAVVTIPDYASSDLGTFNRIVYLDAVADPGNVGTLVRTAEWFGIDAIVSGPGSVEWYNPKVVAAARGSLFRMPHYTLDIGELARLTSSSDWVIADLDGTASSTFAWPTEGILVVGSESQGPVQSRAFLQQQGAVGLAPKLVTIGRADGSKTESLNAGVAGSILLAQWHQAKA